MLQISSSFFSRGRLGALTSSQVEAVWETTVEGVRVTEWVDWEGEGQRRGGEGDRAWKHREETPPHPDSVTENNDKLFPLVNPATVVGETSDTGRGGSGCGLATITYSHIYTE